MYQGLLSDDGRALPMTRVSELSVALEEANIPTLLMVYIALTRDESLLQRFDGHFRSPYSLEPPSLPPYLAADLRARLFGLLTIDPPPAIPPVSPDLMLRMMSVNVGETVNEEYVPMLLEQMGFERSIPRSGKVGRRTPPPDFKVLIIGAGMTGIAAAIKLREAGYDHIIIEKNADAGGTWFENRYPGVGVDTPSHFYSYSFEINPEWNHYLPKGRDMQDYLLGVVKKYGIRDRTQFGTRVIACRYEEAESLWRVTVKTGDRPERTIEASAVINAHGPLNRWAWPGIPGLSDFKGPVMHTAAWNADIDVTGKRVVMIGTGASGHQLAPAIAPQVSHLTILQRSRHWVLRNPEASKPVTQGVKFALRHIPFYREWFRFRVYWFAGDGLFINVLKDPSWPDQSVSVSAHNDAIRRYAVQHLRSSLEGRLDLFDKLLPEHPIFSKRILIDDGWLDALKRNNVTLETQAIDRLEADCVVMADGTRHRADILALATGFNVANMLGPLKVNGRGGRSLGDEWGDEDARSYLGLTMPGYPNFFFTVGPNSAPNHAAGQNIISEAQVNYIIECLDAVIAGNAKTIEPRQQAFDDWNKKIDARMQDMIWTHPKANSYYNNSKGRIYLSWPYRLVDYWNAMRAPNLDHFDVA